MYKQLLHTWSELLWLESSSPAEESIFQKLEWNISRICWNSKTAHKVSLADIPMSTETGKAHAAADAGPELRYWWLHPNNNDLPTNGQKTLNFTEASTGDDHTLVYDTFIQTDIVNHLFYTVLSRQAKVHRVHLVHLLLYLFDK